MLAFTLPICKNLVRRGSLRLMCGYNKNRDNFKVEEDFFESDDVNDRDGCRKWVSYTSRYIMDMQNPDDNEWKNLTEKLKSVKMSNVSTKILHACLRLDKLDTGISYYNYLTREGQQPSIMDLLFFSKLLLKSKSDIQKYEELIIKLYNDIKDFVNESALIRSFVLEIFVEVPTCFYDIIKNRENDVKRIGNFHIVRKALELDMPDVAFDYMQDSDFVANEKLVEGYLNFCIRKAEKGQFSLDYINKLIMLCEKKANVLNHGNLGYLLKSLVNALNNNQEEYTWTVSSCNLSKRNVCLNCGLQLASKSLSESEFQKLREQFFKNAFVRNNVFLTSSETELKRFLNFLDSCHPYDMVIDGLNVMYKSRQMRVKVTSRCLSYFLENDFRVLTIGKEHSRVELTKPVFLSKKVNSKRAQFFFTSNTSDDDLFVLYATLLRGLNTFFLTGDHLTSYITWLDHEMQSLFLKWQMSHQYLITPEGQLELPVPHCGLSQLTQETENKFVWHISQPKIPRSKLQVGVPVNWYCLQATKK